MDVSIGGQTLILPSFSVFRGNVFEAQRCVVYINRFPRDHTAARAR